MEKIAYYWQCLRRNPLAWNLFLIAVVIVGAAVAAHVVMQLGTRHGARRIVPDFAGVKLDDARRIARERSLEIHVNDSLFVPAYEGGIVLDQLPEEGVEVKPGRTVYVTINACRQKRVPVPYVAGRSLRQAKNMLEIAGLEIAELVYRPDIATNYVLEERLGDTRIVETSRVEAEMGSGVTLHVGVEPGHGTTVVPQIVGLSLRDAKSRLWEQGLNIGRVRFDQGINLLNQKEARVYLQIPSAERRATLGSQVELHLTLDSGKISEHRTAAEKQARQTAEQRAAEERDWADSQAAAAELPQGEQTATSDAGASAQGDDDEFFF